MNTAVLLVPAVHSCAARAGSFPVTSETPVVVADVDLGPVAETFVADLEADTGLALTLGAGAGIRVELADDGLDAVPPAGGLRADGNADADERYGLEVTPDGVRVWGRTPEGVHRGLTTLRQLTTAGAGVLDGVRIVDGPRFVEDVFDALVDQFPQTAYLHIGGDETFGMPDAAHAAFVERAGTLVRARGRRLLVWQEAARAHVGPGAVVQYWMEPGMGSGAAADALAAVLPSEVLPLVLDNLVRADDDVPKALAQGATILVSPTGRLYFDRPHAATSVDPAQEQLRARLGQPVYPPTSLRDGVEWDPVDETPGVDDDSPLAGVEAAVWCETVTDRDDLEFLLLPRLAGAAEKAWARRGATDWDVYASRLGAQAPAWDRRGWNWFRSGEVTWQGAAGR